ncbi:MAG: amino acid ABC transporter substrate-binding protein [Firmicutes bacterium]|jgi:ABC-type amino acid transport/signal transduction systems, periplasmic component/domain|nr:amino acid ABC transporter substrate-binding protein [Bacillota bacterium]
MKKNLMKKFLLVLSCLLAMGLLAACSDSDQKQDANNANNQQNETELTGWAYIENKGELIVGLDDAFAPMGFRDEDGNLVGFDIDLANAAGEYLGLDVTFKPIDWDAKDMELSSKRIDCIWNGMSVLPERIEAYSLTKKYLNNKIIIMTLDPELNITSTADLANVTLGTQVSSAALSTMQANPDWSTFEANVTEYATYDEAILAMQGGRVQAIVVDQVLGEYKNANMDNAMSVCDFGFGDDFYAIGCRKGETDVADKINEAIQALIDNGKAAEISEKWFGTNIVILVD